MSQFATIVAAQKRACLKNLSEIPDSALEQPLPFKIQGESTDRKGNVVLNGTVTHEGTTYKAAIFGIRDILAALDGNAPKVGLVLDLPHHRTSGGGVFYARPADEMTPAEAAIADIG